MANTKISQLPGVTVPLSGTEVLPVVQSGTTSQVSVDDLILNSALPSGTANGVLYLNSSKIATSGSALTFDGSTLSVSNNLSVGGTLTLTGGLTLNGNVTVGDSSADTLTINSTITSNLLFTDNTYDIGASGATRPRNLYLAGNALIGTATNTNSSSIVANGTISETVSGTQYLVASQYDIGTDPNQIPLNQYLGNLAYQDAGSIAGNVVIGGTVTSAGITSTGPSVISVNSTSDALRITQTGTGNALVVEDSTNPDSTPFVIDANGIVIKGNTTAINFPDIQGTQRLTGTQVLGSTYLSSGIAVASFINGVNSGASFTLAQSRNTAVGNYTIVNANDTVGSLQFAGSDNTSFIRAASISAAVDGTPGTNDMPGRLVFSTTADGASSPTERMRIDNQGRVGIGSTSLNGRIINVSKDLTGNVNSHGMLLTETIKSDVTNSATVFASNPSTEATSFTLGSLIHFQATQSTVGAGSTITSQYGFAAQGTITGATNNYGFYSNIASGTGRWNFYAGGTAANYFAGTVLIGTTTAGASKLTVADDSIQVNTAKTPASASATGTTGQIAWDSNYVYVCVATNTWKRSALSTW